MTAPKISRKRLLVVGGVAALLVVGALAVRGGASSGRGEGAGAPAPAAPGADARPLALARAAQAKNPVKVAAA